MNTGLTRSFDERAIVARLDAVQPAWRVAFAASAAQRLLGLYLRFHNRTGRGDPDSLTSVLERVWVKLKQGEHADSQDQQVAELLVPDEEDEWVFESGYAQHSAAAVAYAVRTQITGDSQEAAWASRQMYEIADYVALQKATGVQPYSVEAEERSSRHPLVQDAIKDVEKYLHQLESLNGSDFDSLRTIATRDGERLLDVLP